MKNKFFIILFYLLLFDVSYSENLPIEAKNISIDKLKNLTIFKDERGCETDDGYIINSQYGELNKDSGILILKENIKGRDNKNNIIEANFAEYSEKSKIFKTVGPTTIYTSEGYIIEGKNIFFYNDKKIIPSNENALITDKENNQISLEKFNYEINKDIFKSVGNVKIQDKNQNTYEFSQIYIDTKKREILGTDSKLYINQSDFKIDNRNKPRIFSNASKISKNESIFKKSIFTLCNYRSNDKCPPWSIQSGEMLHDNTKKQFFTKML